MRPDGAEGRRCGGTGDARHGSVSGRLIALVETARGVTDVDAIAASGVSRLALGTIDLATELGVDPRAAAPSTTPVGAW